ncbi:MAG: glutaredoxin [Rhodospirillaceae bacterium]|nr:glutaredoxin [Rhodospirillaceae bacterium]
MTAPAPAPVTVYWQPGCTSCLRVKQFLADHGVSFESVNVLADAGARERLAGFGVRTVPVVTRGAAFVFAQELDDVARFLGLPMRGSRLPVPELAARIERLLALAAEMAARLPAEHLQSRIAGRDRTYADLCWHIGQIVVGFLDAARGATLTYKHFERTAPADLGSADVLVDSLAGIRADFHAWWTAHHTRLPEAVNTYYGRQPLHQVCERTTWHMAQHCRQLEHILGALDRGHGFLTPEVLAGLPVPRDVWDREIVPPAET